MKQMMNHINFSLVCAIIILSISIKCSIADIICSATTNECTRAPRRDLSCNGTGKLFEISDECMDDGGKDAVEDSLEVYCVCNRARFCLSGEAYPWRNSTQDTVDDGRTCSRAGLTTSYMANAWCNLWNGHSNYNCCDDGFIGF